jgi:hypothetical protein
MRNNRITICFVLLIGLFCDLVFAVCPNAGKKPIGPTKIIIIRPVIIAHMPKKNNINPPVANANKTDALNEKTMAPTVKNKYAFDSAHLQEILSTAEQSAIDANNTSATEILGKLTDAHAARISFEECFIGQSLEEIEDVSKDVNDAGMDYFYALSDFKDACADNPKATNEAKRLLKLSFVKKMNENKEKQGYFDGRNHIPRIWACAAINPTNGKILKPLRSAKLNQKQGTIIDRTIVVETKIEDTDKIMDVNNPGDSNNLSADSIEPVIENETTTPTLSKVD